MPYFTILAIIFIIVFTIGSRKNSAEQEKKSEDYWKREQEANHTRKKKLDSLNYIHIPLSDFPMNLGVPCEDTLRSLSEAEIVNLTGYSNTDLKLQYGVANLDILSKFDTNYATLVTALADYSKLLLEKDMVEDAKKVLEYGVSIDADSIYIFSTLAKLYNEAGQQESILHLIDVAKELNSISKKPILDNLSQYHISQ